MARPRRWRAPGAAAQGATAYVSLEPCCHQGQTPPCTEALIAAGIARVVVPIEDPDPRVSGQGIARLREAGIAVETGLAAEAAAELNAGFFLRLRAGAAAGHAEARHARSTAGSPPPPARANGSPASSRATAAICCAPATTR